MIAMAAAFAGAAFLVSATLVSASVEPQQIIPTLESNTVSKGDRLDTPASAKGDRLPIASAPASSKNLVVAYRTGPGASLAVLF
jgi:hypothetical protein